MKVMANAVKYLAGYNDNTNEAAIYNIFTLIPWESDKLTDVFLNFWNGHLSYM